MRKPVLSWCFILSFFSCSLFAQGPSWQWAKSASGADWDEGHSIALDASNNIYITGKFSDTVDFDPGPATFQMIQGGLGSWEAFITKSDPNGNLIWAKEINASVGSEAYSLTLDAAGNVYITGYFYGQADFDPGPGTFNMNPFMGSNDAFVLKLDSAGNFIWARKFGGTTQDQEEGYSISVNPLTGDVYTTGYFSGTCDFDPGTGVYNLIESNNNNHIFISKLDSAGNFAWAKSLGGTQDDEGMAIIYDPAGNCVYVTGNYEGTVDFDPGPATFNLTGSGMRDAFVLKLDADGNFIWAGKLAGTQTDNSNAMALNLSGVPALYIAGNFNSYCDFDPGPGGFMLNSVGSGDGFIVRLDTSGNFVWAKQIGNVWGAEISSIVTDQSGDNIFFTGSYDETVDFDLGPGTHNLTSLNLSPDLFVLKLDNTGNFVWVKTANGMGGDNPRALAIDYSDNIYVTGEFNYSSIALDTIILLNDDLGLSRAILYAKLGSCSARYNLYPDTIPLNWIAVNLASGVPPLSYLWSWGDGTTSTGPTPTHVYPAAGYYNICLTITDATGCYSTYCDSSTYINRSSGMITINVVMPGTTGIPELPAASELVHVFPNPTSRLLTVAFNRELEFPEITAMDLSGKEFPLPVQYSNDHAIIDTNPLAEGIYILHVEGRNFNWNGKFIVSR